MSRLMNCRYVVVSDTSGCGFGFDEWVRREFQSMKIQKSGSGYSFLTGERDISGVAPSDEIAKEAKKYFKLFPKVKCNLYEDEED